MSVVTNGIRTGNGKCEGEKDVGVKACPPLPRVFCESLSKEIVCGNECAQLCENKGAEKWID